MNSDTLSKYTLKQYTRLIISFFAALVMLSLYQYTVLYATNTVDTILGISFLLSMIQHLGFASFAGLVCVPLFNFFENWRPKVGFKIVVGVFLALLLFEILLVGYYCSMRTPLAIENGQVDLSGFGSALTGSTAVVISIVPATLITLLVFRLVYIFTKKHYHYLAKMYPFTVILLSIFVATLFLDGKPINQNKTQLLAIDIHTLYRQNDSNALGHSGFRNDEMVWIQSVFSGKNHDKAYLTAKKLAHEKEYKKSLLLSRYIVSRVPDHIDTKILMGRVNAWMGNFDTSATILKDALTIKPDYLDAYAALFDVYYWSGNDREADRLIEMAKAERVDMARLSKKIDRARSQVPIKKDNAPQPIGDGNNKNPETVSIER